jgi:small subunit ribosomal protein S18
MARTNQRGGSAAARRAPKDLGRKVKKKPCALCRDQVTWVDYKDIPMLRKYMSDRGKIRSRRVTGNCAQHQRALAMAIMTARELVLLPYTQRTVTERPGGRRGGDRGGTLSDTTLSAPRPVAVEVAVEVVDDTDAQGDPSTEAAVTAEVEELVEELAEDAAAGTGGGEA